MYEKHEMELAKFDVNEVFAAIKPGSPPDGESYDSVPGGESSEI